MKKCMMYITNYVGNEKIHHINTILSEVNSMEFLKIDVIIFTTEKLRLEKFDNLNIEVRIHPKIFSNSPFAADWQPEPEFIWLYRHDLLTKVGDYDMYIHVEDDILLTRANILQFIKYNFNAPEFEGYITGDFSYEDNGKDILLLHFHMGFRDIGELIKINGEYFMVSKCTHQASNIFTNEHLVKLIDNGYMKAEANTIGIYNIKCSAVCEVYSTPLLVKIIPVTNLQDSMVKHLTNRYIGLSKVRGGFWEDAFQSMGEIEEQLSIAIEKLENE